MELIDSHRSFGGTQQRFQTQSNTLSSQTTFSVYQPDGEGPFPVLYWLSGLTCTDENFVIKAGAQQHAARHGFVVVAPDTSPRGDQVADDDGFDLGTGAGFYVDATQSPWADHYQMYSYIADELPALITQHVPVDSNRVSIFGHSMGGHGALTVAMKNPGRFKSVSAFAPICSPGRCELGQKGFSAYLGDNPQAWQAYDATALIHHTSEQLPILIDQGADDEFLSQLQPQLLQQASEQAGYPINLRMQPGYDHSYFFVASFLGEHFDFHAKHLL